MPSEQDDRDATATRFVAAFAQLHGRHTASRHPRTAVFTATLISVMSITVGVQTGLLLRRAVIPPAESPDRRAFHD